MVQHAPTIHTHPRRLARNSSIGPARSTSFRHKHWHIFPKAQTLTIFLRPEQQQKRTNTKIGNTTTTTIDGDGDGVPRLTLHALFATAPVRHMSASRSQPGRRASLARVLLLTVRLSGACSGRRGQTLRLHYMSQVGSQAHSPSNLRCSVVRARGLSFWFPRPLPYRTWQTPCTRCLL